MTIAEKFDHLKAQCGRHQVICKHVGIPDENNPGSWFTPPMNDPDHDFTIPQLRIFSVNPKQRRQRLADIRAGGWEPFEPEAGPVAVKSKSKSRSSKPKTSSK